MHNQLTQEQTVTVLRALELAKIIYLNRAKRCRTPKQARIFLERIRDCNSVYAQLTGIE